LRRSRVNRTRFKLSDAFGRRMGPLEWTPQREAQFRALCGASMRTLGYELPALETAPAATAWPSAAQVVTG
jgi:hypothetical protein